MIYKIWVLNNYQEAINYLDKGVELLNLTCVTFNYFEVVLLNEGEHRGQGLDCEVIWVRYEVGNQDNHLVIGQSYLFLDRSVCNFLKKREYSLGLKGYLMKAYQGL